MENNGTGCLVVLGLGLIIIFAYLTWPVGILLTISCGLWLFSKASSKLWAQAVAYVFSAVSIGLGILCLALFVLNAFKSTFDPDWVRSAEESLYVLLLHLRTVNSSTIVTILILLTLILVSYYLPHWKLVSKYLWLKKAMSKTIIVLATITSFTFFGQIPMKDWAVQAHNKMVERYRAALRQEWQFQGQYMSAQALENHVRELDEPRRHYYRTVYSTIKSEAFRDGTDYTSVVSEHMADLQSEKTQEALKLLRNASDQNNSATSATEVKLPGEELMERRPATARERSRQLQVLAEQELRAKTAEVKATEAYKGLRKIFSEVITSQVPGIDGVAGIYLKKLVSNYSEMFFEKSVEQYHRKVGQTGTRAQVLASEVVQAAKPEPQLITQLLEPRLAPGMMEQSAVGLAAASPLLRSQITQEVQRVTRMEVNNAITREVARRAMLTRRTSTGGSSGGSYRRPSSRPRVRPRGR